MSKITARASSDVALMKYWGKKDEVLRLPENGSVSLILAGLDTVTTVETFFDGSESILTIDGQRDVEEEKRVVKFLKLIVNEAVKKNALQSTEAQKISFKISSTNTFPKGTGLSSSGSGFAALTLAATTALNLQLSEKELSILARQGSGTACRCMCGGIVEWLDGDTSDTSYSVSLYPPNYWDLRDVVAVVDTGKKKISSTEGHATAQTSPFYQQRLAGIAAKNTQLKAALAAKDFTAFGELVEAEALNFHSILLTSQPPLIAWYPGTIAVMQAVHQLRTDGIPAYFTINTGFNVHVLTLPEHEQKVRDYLKNTPLVLKTLTAKIGNGPTIIDGPKR